MALTAMIGMMVIQPASAADANQGN